MKKYKLGFTLFEVLITVSIVAIFIAACSSVFTQKHKARISLPAHGRYECYWDNGQLKESYYSENVRSLTRNVTECVFQPNRVSAYLVIQAVGPGGAGGTVYGGTAGTYESIFLNNTTHRLKLVPGKPGTTQSTDVYDIGKLGQNTNKNILTAPAGHSSGAGDLQITDCTLQWKHYTAAGVIPNCNVDDDGTVRVNLAVKDVFDPAQVVPATDTVAYDFDISTITSGAQIDGSSNTATYTVKLCNANTAGWTHVQAECNGAPMIDLAILLFNMDENMTANRAISPMSYYLKGLGANTADTQGLSHLNPGPGDGGAKGQPGGTGAVMITW